MSNLYAETKTTGELTQWLAASRMLLTNPPNGGTPTVVVDEVLRKSLNGEFLSETGTRNLTTQLDDPGRKIPYINPDTFEQILTADGQPVEGHYFTAQQIYFAVACLYIDMAEKADKGVA